MPRRLALLFLGFLSSLTFVRAQLPEPTEDASDPVLRAGAATSNITPWLGVSINGGMTDRRVRHVHDELHARALVLESGETRLAIVIADSCMLPRHVIDSAKTSAAEATGIPVEHMLMAATHSHSCGTATAVFQSDPDPEYTRFLARRLAEAVVRAHANRRPARVGWGAGSVPQHVFNRRWKLKPGTMPPDPWGKTDDGVKMNPGRGSPALLEPAGPTDPRLSVLGVTDANGLPLALLANYSLHYVGGVGAGHASADYFGMFCKRAAAELAASESSTAFVAMLSNGTSGDINNIDFRTKGVRREPYEQMRIVAEDVAKEAVRVWRGIEWKNHVELALLQTKLRLGVRRPTEEELSGARAILAAADGRSLRGLREVYANETVDLSRYPAEVELVLQALRIGDLAIPAIPCEVFVEIGLELRERSPFESTFTIELANGYNGYLPTFEQHALGGYETWRAKSSYLEVGAAPKIVAAIAGLFEELR